MKFRSKVVEIDAWQWNADIFGMPDWIPAYHCEGERCVIEAATGCMTIPTLEGVMTASPGDWIIRGTEGELYPCKPSVFQRKYEPAATTAKEGT